MQELNNRKDIILNAFDERLRLQRTARSLTDEVIQFKMKLANADAAQIQQQNLTVISKNTIERLNQELQQENSNACSEAQRYQVALANLKDTLLARDNTITEQRTKLAQSTATIEGLRDELAEASRAIQQSLDELDHERSQLTSLNIRYTDVTNDLLGNNNELQEQLNAANESLRLARDKLEAAEHTSNSNDSQFNCGVCNETRVNCAYTPCGHTYCESCAQQWHDKRLQDGQEPTCPYCRSHYSSYMSIYLAS